MNDLRIAHVSDTHLGYRAGAVPGRDEDFYRSWIAACNAIVDHKPDIIVHAGDLFHHPHPSWNAVAAFLEGAFILQASGIPTLMISGNHDSSRILMKHTVFSILRNTLPGMTIANEDDPICVSVDNIETDVVLLPHRALLNPLLSVRLAEIISVLNPERYAILVAHGDIAENTKGENNELGSIAIPKLIFDHPWSYIALGHLHMAQPFGRNGWYSGSIERCGWSDFPASPAWTSTVVSKTKSIRHTQMDLPHRRFVQPDSFKCEGVSDFDLLDEIIYRLGRENLKDDAVIIRLIFDEASNHRIRGLERSICDRIRAIHPKASVQVAVKNSLQVREKFVRESKSQRLTSIVDMFQEFVEGREYPTPEYKEFILEGGLAALRKCQEAEEGKDTGDERTVAVA